MINTWPFIEVTAAEDEKKFLLNVEKIVSINPNRVTETTQLWFSPVDAYAVKETYEEIKDLLGMGCDCDCCEDNNENLLRVYDETET